MEDSDFSERFCQFIQTTVPTVDAAEVLLALAAQPERWWDAAQLAEALRPSSTLTTGAATRHLETFHARGLLAAEPPDRFQYRPASEDLAAQVVTLAQAYTERPVTLIRIIYALRDAKIRSFAEAFKVRR